MAANRGTAHQSRPWPPLRAAACGRYKGPPAPLQALWGDRLYRIGGSRLRLKPQLAGLHVGGVCKQAKQAKTAKIGALTILGANWGSVDNSVGVQVYQGGQ